MIMFATARPLPSTICEVELNNNENSMHTMIELKCSLRINNNVNLTELNFHIPEPLAEYSEISNAANNSRTLTLTLHSAHILLNAISCRLNQHREDVCFFNIHLINSSSREMKDSARNSPEVTVNKHDPFQKVYNLLWTYLFLSCLGFAVYVYGHFIFQFK
jgi:hypothetical protein